jgi:hypothetical protein
MISPEASLMDADEHHDCATCHHGNSPRQPCGRILDPETGALLHVLESVHTEAITSLTWYLPSTEPFHPMIVSTSDDRTAVVSGL